MRILIVLLCVLPSSLWANDVDVRAIVNKHILPGYAALARETDMLARAAGKDCSPQNPALVAAYHSAFDAWVRVSHLRFGPSETNDRAFALAFWPDSRGKTPKALSRLIRDKDPVVKTPEGFASVSIAARGFYALEFLMFDPQFTGDDSKDYRCALLRAVAVDISANAAAINAEWRAGYANAMIEPGGDPYRSSADVNRVLFTALMTGLEFTEQARLGRPLGTVERPRPNRAEARRSGRSLRNVTVSLQSAREIATLLAPDDERLERSFASAQNDANALEDSVFAGVNRLQNRFKLEVLQQRISDIRDRLAQSVGPRLGVVAGFNSLDGD